MKKLIVLLMLHFTVVAFAHADEKTEVQLLQERLNQCIGRLASEYTSTLRDLQKVQPELQPVTDKEAKEKKE